MSETPSQSSHYLKERPTNWLRVLLCIAFSAALGLAVGEIASIPIYVLGATWIGGTLGVILAVVLFFAPFDMPTYFMRLSMAVNGWIIDGGYDRP